MPLKPSQFFAPRRLRQAVALSLLLLPMGAISGCNPFAARPPAVADSVEQAFKDGAALEADARTAEGRGDKTEAQERWNKTAQYYAAVAQKYAGSENGLKASVQEARIQETNLKNDVAAQGTLKNALKQYRPAEQPTLYAEARAEYEGVIERMDKKNQDTPYYKAMDTLVRVFGNDQRVSPLLAIVFIAVLVTLLTWPLRRKQYASFREMQRYTPELQKLQAKYKTDPAVLHQKTQEFYKKHGINQFAGCLPLLLQWPITLLMYQVILHYQYHFTQTYFLWMNPKVGDLAANFPQPFAGALAHNLGEPDVLMLVVYAFSMYLTTKLMPTQPATDPAMAEQQKMMAVVMPVIFFAMMLSWQPAAAFVFYWFISNVFSLIQQKIIYRSLPKVTPLVIEGDDDDSDGAAKVSGEKPSGPNPKLISPMARRK